MVSSPHWCLEHWRKCVIVSYLLEIRILIFYAQAAEVNNATLMIVVANAYWDDEMWRKVSDYCAELAAQRERKAKSASSSSSLSGFSPSMPGPLCKLSSSSIDSAVVACIASSSLVCAVTFALSSPIVSGQPFVFSSAEIATEPGQKRKREDSESSAILKMEMWTEFEKLCALHSQEAPACLSVNNPGSSSSSSHLSR